MIYLVGLLLFSKVFGGPLSSCYDQVNCISLDVSKLDENDDNGNKQYEICLYFDDSLEDCDKEDAISHVCTIDEDSEPDNKIEDFEAGLENALCDVVSCDGATSFGIKDGKSCDTDQFIYAQGIGGSNYNETIMCYDAPVSCGSKKQNKACRWLVPAPRCDDDTTTSTTSPETTSSETTTTKAATTTQEATTTTKEATTTQEGTTTQEATTTATTKAVTTTSTTASMVDCTDCEALSNDPADGDGLNSPCDYCIDNCINAEAEGCLFRNPPADNTYPVYSRDEKSDDNDWVIPDEIIAEDKNNTIQYENEQEQEQEQETQNENNAQSVKTCAVILMSIVINLF